MRLQKECTNIGKSNNMTNLEKATRATLMQFLLNSIGATELNPVQQVRNYGAFLMVQLEDGTRKDVTITVTNAEE